MATVTPGLGRLLELINNSNSLVTALTVDNVEVISIADDTTGSGRDTVAVLKGIDGGPYKGQVSVYYNRVNLALITGAETNFVPQNGYSKQFIVNDLNTRYDAFLHITDFELSPNFPADDSDGDSTHTLTATVDSVAWRGETQYTYIARPLLQEAFSSLIFNGI